MSDWQQRLPFAGFAVLALLVAACGAGTEEADRSRNEPSPPAAATEQAGPKPATSLPLDDPGWVAALRYTALFYTERLEELHGEFSDEMREGMPLERLREMRAHVSENYGEEGEVLGWDSDRSGQYRAFVRWARFSKHEDPIEIQWILRPDKSVAGFFLRPARSAPPSRPSDPSS